MPGGALSTSMRFRPALWAMTAFVVLLVGATIALWAHYGAAVFLETIAAGLAACF
jgi:hypothetical protein